MPDFGLVMCGSARRVGEGGIFHSSIRHISFVIREEVTPVSVPSDLKNGGLSYEDLHAGGVRLPERVRWSLDILNAVRPSPRSGGSPVATGAQFEREIQSTFFTLFFVFRAAWLFITSPFALW